MVKTLLAHHTCGGTGIDEHRVTTNLVPASVFFGCAILFSLFTVFYQVSELGRAYLMTDQLNRHRYIVQGVAGSPYQYRILSEYPVEGLIRLFTSLDASQPIIS